MAGLSSAAHAARDLCACLAAAIRVVIPGRIDQLGDPSAERSAAQLIACFHLLIVPALGRQDTSLVTRNNRAERCVS
jgi:hypothetical protein